MKKFYLLVILFGLFSVSAYAQGKLVFGYDQAGNQIKRTYSSTANANSLVSQASAVSEVPTDSNTTDQIRIYPNPTSGVVTADWTQEYQGKITAVQVQAYNNFYSQQWKITTSTQNKITIDLSSQPAGIYIVVFYLADGGTISKKIIKL